MLKKILTVIGLLVIYSANATDTLFVVRDTMLLNKDYIRLRPITWKFHEGKNEKWAVKDFDDSSWQEATLEEVEKMQTNAKDYCFRLHFRTESSPDNPLYIRTSLGIPSLLFLNGKQINHDKKEFSFSDYKIDYTINNPVLIDMYKENTITIFSDFSVRNFIKNKTCIAPSIQVSPQLITAKSMQNQKIRIQRYYMMLSSTAAALALLTFFSWFLVFQDRKDKSMVWITTIIFIQLAGGILNLFREELTLYLKDLTIFDLINNLITVLWVCLIPAVISNVVLNKTDKIAKYFSIFSLVAYEVPDFFTTSVLVEKFGGIFKLALGIIIVIYIVVLFKNNLSKLSKPQWAVILGLFITLMSGIITIVMDSYFSIEYTTYYLLTFITYISFPVSLLIYASLSLRQNFVTIQEKAHQVTKLSAEKEKILKDQNQLLEQQVEARTAELKASQVQLIQKEKLASLGELTAGIAHEIQNPLNFVNNFSEVSAELVSEIQDEEAKSDRDVELIQDLLTHLNSNLQKIHHHGGRASSIVKSMLEHSRTESGEKRPTDLAALADEYLKIAFHGMRAKDKSFNCELITDFDPGLEQVVVAPQEIGRVLLNLYNNAFYAVSERARQGKDSDYKPRVEVRTIRDSNFLQIQVRDNGIGIPESVKSKIFQPFFTTKPTGEGTGLGLSLSYDIVTKGHGGTLRVDSQAGEGTMFVIELPQRQKNNF